MQNGNPATLLIVNKRNNRVERTLTLPTRVPAGCTASSVTCE
jgi:hypothetical protein